MIDEICPVCKTAIRKTEKRSIECLTCKCIISEQAEFDSKFGWSKLKTAGKVSKGDGKDVAHKNGNPKDNKRKNLTVKPKSVNRSFARTKTAKKVSGRS
jgi:transcription initiation factor TFIIIB Brf1 subunit/transcription initiation factor TFIIB